MNYNFFSVIIGKSGSGKTSLLINFLSDRKIYKRVFDKIILCIPEHSYNNMKKFESYLQSVTDIDWIIVRPSRLIDTPLTGVYRVSARYAPKGGSKISRADLAQFMLKQLNSGEWLRKTPTLTY